MSQCKPPLTDALTQSGLLFHVYICIYLKKMLYCCNTVIPEWDLYCMHCSTVYAFAPVMLLDSCSSASNHSFSSCKTISHVNFNFGVKYDKITHLMRACRLCVTSGRQQSLNNHFHRCDQKTAKQTVL